MAATALAEKAGEWPDVIHPGAGALVPTTVPGSASKRAPPSRRRPCSRVKAVGLFRAVARFYLSGLDNNIYMCLRSASWC